MIGIVPGIEFVLGTAQEEKMKKEGKIRPQTEAKKNERHFLLD